MFGKGSYPLVILVSAYFICLLLAARQTIDNFRRISKVKNKSRKAFLLVFSLFLCTRIITYTVPFPFNEMWGNLIADQFPRFFLFFAWELLALWMGEAIFPQPKGKQCCKYFYQILIFAVLGLMFVACICVSTLSNALNDKHHQALMIINSILYFTIVMFISSYEFRLIRICCTSKLSGVIRFRMHLMVILILFMWIIFIARFCWSFFKIFHINKLSQYVDEYSIKCYFDDSKCGQLYLRTVALQFCWEILPSVILLVMFSVLEVHTKPNAKASRYTLERGGAGGGVGGGGGGGIGGSGEERRSLRYRGEDGSVSEKMKGAGKKKKKKKKKKKGKKKKGAQLWQETEGYMSQYLTLEDQIQSDLPIALGAEHLGGESVGVPFHSNSASSSSLSPSPSPSSSISVASSYTSFSPSLSHEEDPNLRVFESQRGDEENYDGISMRTEGNVGEEDSIYAEEGESEGNGRGGRGRGGGGGGRDERYV
eukprot:MONOS_14742.1-p1 / transcript=MONOS_14742.1 / gene=MONOS_14742 / organism=Monocercomonoides_exilis_PA203 / gene_product=unspecified product / transcript_product=unspecified product / location=Mono_scaffold01062:14677-16411(-) / protein_length=482 / sequence_SO=supercontig / SO=protein_coding / is_pseudo=false